MVSPFGDVSYEKDIPIAPEASVSLATLAYFNVKSRKKYLLFFFSFFCLCHFLWSASLAPAPPPPPHPKAIRQDAKTLTCKRRRTKHPICAISSKGAALIDSTLVTFSNTRGDAVGEERLKSKYR